MIQVNRDLALQQNFDPSQYMGTWYEQFRSKDMRFEKYDQVQARYSLNPDQSVTVVNSQFNTDKNFVDAIKGKAFFNGAQGSVKFFWYVPGGDYRVVDTDYTNYAIVYSSYRILGLIKQEHAWILTRDRFPSEQLLEKAMGILTSKVPSVTQDSLRKTAHKEDDAPYQIKEENVRCSYH